MVVAVALLVLMDMVARIFAEAKDATRFAWNVGMRGMVFTQGDSDGDLEIGVGARKPCTLMIRQARKTTCVLTERQTLTMVSAAEIVKNMKMFCDESSKNETATSLVRD